MKYYLLLLVGGLSILMSAVLHGQVAGTPDPSFDPNIAATEVFATAVQPDGKILLGGDFSAVGGQPRANLARLNADGTLESTTTFDTGSGPNGRVGSIVVRGDGRILIGGDFTTVNGQERLRIALLNPDGSLADLATFDASTGANDRVRSLILQSDGRILITGEFTTINGQSRNRIARLEGNGTLESTATFNTGTGANSIVYGAAVQPDGKIVIWGGFSAINGQTRTRVARLSSSGALESTATFNPGTGANEIVICGAMQRDGSILLGGLFTRFNGQTRHYVARLLSDGTLESTATFNPGTGPNNTVRSIIVQTDGTILLAGLFTTVDGQSRNRIARLLSNGALESTATYNPGNGANSNISGIAAQVDGKTILVGNFNSVNGLPRNSGARLFNTPATQSFSASATTRIQWMRGGAAAEVEQVTFELSTDGGVNWLPLGTGRRITGGWELIGLNLPPTGRVRARGRTTGGYLNGSSGLMESVAVYSFLTPLQTWRLANFGTSAGTGNAADSADPDKDGMENLVEFAFGWNPNAPDAAALPQWQPSDGEYVVQFTRPASVSGITYVAEYSTSLAAGGWTPVVNTGIPPVYSFSAPAATSRLYLRVRVTTP